MEGASLIGLAGRGVLAGKFHRREPRSQEVRIQRYDNARLVKGVVWNHSLSKRAAIGGADRAVGHCVVHDMAEIALLLAEIRDDLERGRAIDGGRKQDHL